MQDSVAAAFRLFLLRHARSGWALPGQRDFDRALDDIGYAEAELIAQAAADHGIRPDLILCSTAARCRQTAEPLYRALGEDIDVRYVDPLYTGPTSVYMDLMEAHANRPSLMIIGHNPMIEELFRQILENKPRAQLCRTVIRRRRWQQSISRRGQAPAPPGPQCFQRCWCRLRRNRRDDDSMPPPSSAPVQAANEIPSMSLRRRKHSLYRDGKQRERL